MKIEKEAEAALSEDLVDAIVLLPQGMASDVRRAALAGALGGVLGGAGRAAAIGLGMSSDVEPQPAPALDGAALLARTAHRIVLFEARQGGLRIKLGRLVRTFEPGDLLAVHVGRAAVGVSDVVLTSPVERFVHQVANRHLPQLRVVAALLGAPFIEV
jgi:hypothetical protein